MLNKMNTIKIPTDRFPNCEVQWTFIDESSGLRPHYKFWVRNGEERFPWQHPDSGPLFPVGAGQATLEEVERDARSWVANQVSKWDSWCQTDAGKRYLAGEITADQAVRSK